MQSNEQQQNRKGTNICLIGAFPPPVVGISLITEEVKKSLLKLGASIFVINLSPHTLTKNWKNAVFRPSRVIIGFGRCIKYLSAISNLSIYLAVSGGLGQVYDLFFILLARLFGKRVFLHHHSYAYIDKKRFLTGLLLQIAGDEAIHILLCDDMQEKFHKLYKTPKKTEVVSNAGILGWHKVKDAKPKIELKTVGILSNIVFDKGIAEYLEVVEHLEKKGLQLTSIIAGPFQNNDVEVFVRKRIDMLENVRYVGAKYGNEKAAFFDSIDVLLFPTKYVNEAEPLTIIEAMSFGVLVIAWERGCISSLIPPGTGLLVPKDNNFVHEAVNRIEFWCKNVSDFQELSYISQEWFYRMQNLHYSNFDKLLRKML